jgi:hypothetical protein
MIGQTKFSGNYFAEKNFLFFSTKPLAQPKPMCDDSFIDNAAQQGEQDEQRSEAQRKQGR